MKEIFHFGTENLDGRLQPKTMNENVEIFSEFLFDYNMAKNPDYEEEYLGYATLGEHSYAIKAEFSRCDNWIRYSFFLNTWLDDEDLDEFKRNILEYFIDNEVSVEMVCCPKPDYGYDTDIVLFFFDRVND